MTYKHHNKQLLRQIKRLQKELKSANQFKDLYRDKWEKWEDRSRALYHEVHGNHPTKH